MSAPRYYTKRNMTMPSSPSNSQVPQPSPQAPGQQPASPANQQPASLAIRKLKFTQVRRLLNRLKLAAEKRLIQFDINATLDQLAYMQSECDAITQQLLLQPPENTDEDAIIKDFADLEDEIETATLEFNQFQKEQGLENNQPMHQTNQPIQYLTPTHQHPESNTHGLRR